MKIFPKLLLIAAVAMTAAWAAPQPKAAREPSPDQREITNFRLTTDNFNKYSNATAAMLKLTQSDAVLRKQMEEEQKGKTLDQGAAALGSHPSISATLHGAGLSPREYLVMTGAVIGSTMAVGMKKQGMIKEIPPSISPENAAFVEQNYEKVTALMQKMQEQNK